MLANCAEFVDCWRTARSSWTAASRVASNDRSSLVGRWVPAQPTQIGSAMSSAVPTFEWRNSLTRASSSGLISTRSCGPKAMSTSSCGMPPADNCHAPGDRVLRGRDERRLARIMLNAYGQAAAEQEALFARRPSFGAERAIVSLTPTELRAWGPPCRRSRSSATCSLKATSAQRRPVRRYAVYCPPSSPRQRPASETDAHLGRRSQGTRRTRKGSRPAAIAAGAAEAVTSAKIVRRARDVGNCQLGTRPSCDQR